MGAMGESDQSGCADPARDLPSSTTPSRPVRTRWPSPDLDTACAGEPHAPGATMLASSATCVWSLAECESITLVLANRAIEIGHIEAVVPVFQIVHPARMDEVAPDAIAAHWHSTLAVAVRAQRAVKRRLGTLGQRWTIGELHLLTGAMLALPAFPLLEGGGTSPQPPLHPALASLIHLAGALHRRSHAALRSRDPGSAGEPVDVTALSAPEVCDGSGCAADPAPDHLAAMLTAIVESAADHGDGAELPAELGALIARLPEAIDYGLYGMQAWAVSRSVWIAMSRAYQRLLAILEDALASDNIGCPRLLARLQVDWHALEALRLTADRDRDAQLAIYADTYERSWQASRSPIGRPEFAPQIAPRAEAAMHRVIARRLRAILDGRWLDGTRASPCDAPADAAENTARRGLRDAMFIERIVDVLIYYLRAEQAVLAAVTAIQDAINRLLRRPRPVRALTVRDLHASHAMTAVGVAPYLLDSLDEELGLRVLCAAEAVELLERGDPG